MQAPSLGTIATLGWVFFSLDAVFVLRLLLARNMGDDAAGRGLATGWGLILLPVVLVTGGLLFLAQKGGSYLGVLAATLVVGLPFLAMAREVVMGPVSGVKRALARRGRGKFHDPRLTRLATAIERRDLAAVKGLAATPGLDLAARDGKGRTPLGIAAEAATSNGGGPEDVESARVLLAHGARLDVRDDRTDRPGWDVLMNAVEMQSWDLAALEARSSGPTSGGASSGRS